MEKRLPLALFLSFLVLFGWTLLNPPAPEEGEVAPGESAADPASGAPAAGEARPAAANTGDAAAAAPLAPEIAGDEERTHELVVGRAGEPGHYRLVFSNRGGRLVELDLGDYFREVGLDEEQRSDSASWLPLIEPVETEGGATGSLLLGTSPSSRDLAPSGLDQALWKMEVLEGEGVLFSYGPGTGVVFRKRITAVPGTWHLALELSIENRSAGAAGRRDFLLTPAGCVPPELGDNFYPEPRAVAVGADDDGAFESDTVTAASADREGGSLDVPPPPLFVGVHNKYFAFLVRAADEADRLTLLGARYEPVVPVVPIVTDDGEREYVQAKVPLALRLPDEGETSTFRYTIYAGPKERDAFVGDFEPHAEVLSDDLSTFSGIGEMLLAILRFLHGIFGNWGVAIIVLTMGVRAALFPLNRRSQTAMARYQKKMKRVQPKIDEAKKRFADDPKKQREAQAKIMQEEGAFPPLGGCLPIFVQIPVFFGLFSALRTSFDLRQAPFAGWITDLSRPDRLLRLDLSIPLGITTIDVTYLNILPILMVVLWILQQKGMPKPSDEQQAKMQKMMMFMPILFGFLLYNYAAGLSLYMITQSGLGIVEQRVIKKLWPVDDTEPETKKKSGCGPFSGFMENLAEKHREQMKVMQARQAETARAKSKGKKKRR